MSAGIVIEPDVVTMKLDIRGNLEGRTRKSGLWRREEVSLGYRNSENEASWNRYMISLGRMPVFRGERQFHMTGLRRGNDWRMSI